MLESHEQGVDKSRAHSLEIEVCERNVSAKHPEKGEVISVEEGRDVERDTEDDACVDLSCDETREKD